ncbi:hypothetical protein ACFYO1_37545 [Nocardia sp. NPDC006044]|uniref:hypothetical protein n=1 Tax=Nocardia sp. NPDC006044 TaxID=3364306 RepID=UPI0036AB7A81
MSGQARGDDRVCRSATLQNPPWAGAAAPANADAWEARADRDSERGPVRGHKTNVKDAQFADELKSAFTILPNMTTSPAGFADQTQRSPKWVRASKDERA